MIHPPEACTAPWFTQLQGSSRLWHISEKRNLEFNLSRLIYAKTSHLHISSPILSLGISVLCRTKTISTSKLQVYLIFFWLSRNYFPSLSALNDIFHGSLNLTVWVLPITVKHQTALRQRKWKNSAIGAEHWKIKRLYFVFFEYKRKNSTYLYYILFPFCFSSWAQIEQPHVTSAV